MEEDTLATTQEAPAAASRWEDYIDIFISPAELYRRRAHDRVLPPFLTLIGLALLFYFLLLPANGMVMRASATDEQALAAMERMGTLMTVFGAIMVPVLYALVIVTAAAFLWLGGRMADIRTDFGRMALIATYAAFVYLLSQIAGAVSVLIHGEAGLDVARHMSFGPLRFMGSMDMNNALMAFLRRFELFAIWQAVLWAVGLRAIYRVGWARAGAVAFAAWLLFIIPGMIGAIMSTGARPG